MQQMKTADMDTLQTFPLWSNAGTVLIFTQTVLTDIYKKGDFTGDSVYLTKQSTDLLLKPTFGIWSSCVISHQNQELKEIHKTTEKTHSAA